VLRAQHAIHRTKIAAGIGDLHFHDLRGTAATRFYVAGLPERVIAEILGWQGRASAKSSDATLIGRLRPEHLSYS
jgi:integrase